MNFREDEKSKKRKKKKKKWENEERTFWRVFDKKGQRGKWWWGLGIFSQNLPKNFPSKIKRKLSGKSLIGKWQECPCGLAHGFRSIRFSFFSFLFFFFLVWMLPLPSFIFHFFFLFSWTLPLPLFFFFFSFLISRVGFVQYVALLLPFVSFFFFFYFLLCFFFFFFVF